MPGKLVEWRGQSQRFGGLRGCRRALVNPPGDRIAAVAIAPVCLGFLTACRLTVGIPAGPLTGSYSRVRPEPPATDRARSLPDLGHRDDLSSSSRLCRPERRRQFRIPGSFLESRTGKLLASAEVQTPGSRLLVTVLAAENSRELNLLRRHRARRAIRVHFRVRIGGTPVSSPPAIAIAAGNHDFHPQNRLEDASPMPLSPTAQAPGCATGLPLYAPLSGNGSPVRSQDSSSALAALRPAVAAGFSKARPPEPVNSSACQRAESARSEAVRSDQRLGKKVVWSDCC